MRFILDLSRIRTGSRGAPLALLLPLLAGCDSKTEAGGASTRGGSPSGKSAAALLDEAQASMQSEDWKGAQSKLRQAESLANASAEDRAEAWQQDVVCEARLKDDAAASKRFKEFVATKLPLKPDQYAVLALDLSNANRPQTGIEVVAHASELFKNDKTVHKKLKRVANKLAGQAAQSSDSSGLDTLKRLGYVGGSNEDDDEDEAPKKDGKASDR